METLLMGISIPVKIVGDIIQIAGAGITWAGNYLSLIAAKKAGVEEDIRHFSKLTSSLFPKEEEGA